MNIVPLAPVPNLERVAALIRETADSELLPRLGRLAAGDIREKRPGDLVTIADESAERAITAGLHALLPGVPVIGEEAVAADPSLLSHLDALGHAWLVDGLDGTSNFAAGKEAFAIIVCLLRAAEPVAGWILHPVSGVMAMAEEGAGVTLDGARVRLEPAPPLSDMNGFLTWHFLRRLDADPLREAALRRFGQLGSKNCAGLEYLQLLQGARHFSLYRRTRPWDHAAGALMIGEAGGVAARFDGASFAANQPSDAGILSAPDRSSWQQIHDLLLG